MTSRWRRRSLRDRATASPLPDPYFDVTFEAVCLRSNRVGARPQAVRGLCRTGQKNLHPEVMAELYRSCGCFTEVGEDQQIRNESEVLHRFAPYTTYPTQHPQDDCSHPGIALDYSDRMPAIPDRAWLRAKGLSWGRQWVPSTRAAVREALDLLAPWESGTPLVRVGGDGDGGYLVPDRMDGIAALFSPGVSETWDFERHVAESFGMPSFMVDGSVDAPPGLTDMQHFSRKWLGPKSHGDVVSLEDWIGQSRISRECDLLLQMDIEGSEYGVLASAPLATLRRFRIAVVEFHGLDWIAVGPVLKLRILPALRKMAVDFEVVHVHPNNCCGVQRIYGVPVPRVLEVTYLRRDHAASAPARARLPHPLDRDCVAGNPSLDLSTHWPR